ncbi:hypothetical protein BDW59DRAFT_137642 [Aspergillus cavernicola]|uniref:Methyltransferase-domain-containing protein n=1 Tax=Aspergillus cavernicola TaxID=176166 RepID=A0ABR4J410_9EURO
MMGDVHNFLTTIGQEVEDAEEESFLLFSQDIPSSNLGFVNSRATTLDITIHDQDYTIHQSPTLLSSSRAGGTTGAVLWKITPVFAEWISATSSNPLWTHSLLTPSSAVVELGCGISGLTALTLSPLITHFIATDQEYVHRLFRQNLECNPPSRPRIHLSSKGTTTSSNSKGKRQSTKASSKINPSSSSSGSSSGSGSGSGIHPNITFTSLDWELDHPETLKQSISIHPTQPPNPKQPNSKDMDDDGEEEDKGFDILLSCDCIYNESLIAPFVRTCAEISRLRPICTPLTSSDSGKATKTRQQPTICIIAQQQRSPDVFEAWLAETMKYFRVWRVSDELLGQGLSGGSGYLVHILVLRG